MCVCVLSCVVGAEGGCVRQVSGTVDSGDKVPKINLRYDMTRVVGRGGVGVCV